MPARPAQARMKWPDAWLLPAPFGQPPTTTGGWRMTAPRVRQRLLALFSAFSSRRRKDNGERGRGARRQRALKGRRGGWDRVGQKTRASDAPVAAGVPGPQETCRHGHVVACPRCFACLPSDEKERHVYAHECTCIPARRAIPAQRPQISVRHSLDLRDGAALAERRDSGIRPLAHHGQWLACTSERSNSSSAVHWRSNPVLRFCCPEWRIASRYL